MPENLKLALLAAIVALTLSVPRAWARKKQDRRAEAEALITKALAVSDLRAPGSPPFEMRGIIEVHQSHGKPAEGSYLLLWESPDKWREEIHFSDYERIRVGGKDEYWQARNTQYEPLPLLDLSRALGFADMLEQSQTILKDPKTRVKLRNRKTDHHQVICADLQHGMASRADLCFDPALGTLVSARNVSLGMHSLAPTTFSSFIDFSGESFPSRMEIDWREEKHVTFEVAGITPLGKENPAEFAPPSGSTLWPTCPAGMAMKSKLVKEVQPEYPAGAREAHISGTVVVYAVVAPDGTLHDLHVVSAPSRSLAGAALSAVQGWRYQPLTCGGRPIRVETTISVVFTLGE